MKDFLIKIKGMQELDGDKDTIELTTIGKYGFKNGTCFISYDDSEMLGIDNVKTVVHIKEDNTVVLQRNGGINSRLTVKEGKRSTSFYSTVHGEMMIGIFGESIEKNLGNNGGFLKMRYTIDSNLKLVSRNTIEISVKEVN